MREGVRYESRLSWSSYQAICYHALPIATIKSKRLKKIPNYHEKITSPLTDQDFQEGMENGYFVEEPQHPGLVALLHYSAVRITEGLNTKRRQFRLTPDILFYDVGERLKHSHRTEALPLPLNAPYVSCIVDSLKDLKPEDRVWPYCRKTGYNIVHRVFKYPHYHRLSRITWFFMPDRTAARIQYR
jgi:hypothetical protein